MSRVREEKHSKSLGRKGRKKKWKKGSEVSNLLHILGAFLMCIKRFKKLIVNQLWKNIPTKDQDHQ
jgi:hypothetical protein